MYYGQDVADHMQVAVQGQGETQVVHIFGDGVLFPMIQAFIRTAGFTRSEEANRWILSFFCNHALIFSKQLICSEYNMFECSKQVQA